MIEFNLERALAGDPVVTRDGRKVTQLVKFVASQGDELWGVIGGQVESWRDNGHYHNQEIKTRTDLFMAQKKPIGFVNVYLDGEVSLHTTRQDADSANNVTLLRRLSCIDLSTIKEGHGL